MKNETVKWINNAMLVLVVAFISSLAIMLFISPAFAAEAVAAAPSIVDSAEKVGWLSGALALALQVAKSDILGGIFAKIDPAYQPAVVLVLGQLGGLVESVASGKPLATAAIEWLLISGNAMALYTVVFKPFKKKSVKV